MKSKVITNEQLKKVLDTFFVGGYGTGGSHSEFYIGYMTFLGVSDIGLPLEINLDGGGTCIVFSWYPEHQDERTNIEIGAYICGVMSQLMPELKLWEEIGENKHMIMFEPKDRES